MARILIVGGGCRGRSLARALGEDSYAVRITSREGRSRADIEAAGAECWPGDPDRLATLRGSLDGVAILAWMLGGADGAPEELAQLHGERLEFFLTQAIDTTVRGFLYEASGTRTPPAVLAAGEEVVERITARNAIPVRVLRADPLDTPAWIAAARSAIASLLGL